MKVVDVWVIVYMLNPSTMWQPSPKDLRFANKEDCESFRKIEQTRFIERIPPNKWLTKKPDDYYTSSCEQAKIVE